MPLWHLPTGELSGIVFFKLDRSHQLLYCCEKHFMVVGEVTGAKVMAKGAAEMLRGTAWGEDIIQYFTVRHQTNVIMGGARAKVKRSEGCFFFQGPVNSLLTQ